MRFIESEVIERRNGHTYGRVIEIVYDECAFIYKNGQAHSKIPPATSDICKQCKHRLKHLVGECYNQVTIEALQKEWVPCQNDVHHG